MGGRQPPHVNGGVWGARVRPPRTLPDAPRGLSVLNRLLEETRKLRIEILAWLGKTVHSVRSGAGVGVGMLRGAGDPFFSKFLDIDIYQDSTIVKLVFLPKRVGVADRIGDTKI